MIPLLKRLKQPTFLEAIKWPPGPCMILPPLASDLISYCSPHSICKSPSVSSFLLEQTMFLFVLDFCVCVFFCLECCLRFCFCFFFCLECSFNKYPQWLLPPLSPSTLCTNIPFSVGPSLTTKFKIATFTSIHRQHLTSLPALVFSVAL